MTYAVPKLLTVVAAAAFLSISPLAAQVTGGPDVQPAFELDERVDALQRQDMHERFYESDMPAPAELRTVPDQVVQAFPEVAGYHYYTLPGERIVLVNPETQNIAMILDKDVVD